MKCPQCNFVFDPSEVLKMLRVACWYSGHDEPAVTPDPTPVPDSFASIDFRTPATAPGGKAYFSVGLPETGKRPTILTAVFVPTGSVPEDQRTPEVLLNGTYPAASSSVVDGQLEVDVTVEGLEPGLYDVAGIASYED